MIELNKIYNKDCLEGMKEIEDNSIDSIVTDPPYGWSFMGKKWDYEVPKVEVWEECLRVLKPGGHALVACGTRTQHRMAVNIEDAGFEIRDIICWAYGSGFPKSLNVGKAIDKRKGTYIKGEISPNSRNSGESPSGCYSEGVQTKTLPNPQSNEAKEWNGWGTSLKPSVELWTLARKPLGGGTVAENVLKYGTGGINVDGCRIGNETIKSVGGRTSIVTGDTRTGKALGIYGQHESLNIFHLGRFPANLIHDGSDEVVGLFPETSPTKPHEGDGKKLDTQNMGWGFKRMPCGLSDNGGSAARFFYCAKTSKAERNEGLEGENTNKHCTVKPIDLMKYLCRLITPKKGTVLDPFIGSGTTAIAARNEGFKFIGFEIDSDYCEIARARIKKHLEQRRLDEI